MLLGRGGRGGGGSRGGRGAEARAALEERAAGAAHQRRRHRAQRRCGAGGGVATNWRAGVLVSKCLGCGTGLEPQPGTPACAGLLLPDPAGPGRSAPSQQTTGGQDRCGLLWWQGNSEALLPGPGRPCSLPAVRGSAFPTRWGGPPGAAAASSSGRAAWRRANGSLRRCWPAQQYLQQGEGRQLGARRSLQHPASRVQQAIWHLKPS